MHMPAPTPDWKYDAISLRDAYRAMCVFLLKQYKMMNSEDLGFLAGATRLVAGDESADPSFKKDWLEAVEQVRNDPQV